MKTMLSSFQRQAWADAWQRADGRQTSIQTVLLVAALATARQVVIGRRTVDTAQPSVWEHVRMAGAVMLVLSPIYGLIAWSASGSLSTAALSLLVILAAQAAYEAVRVSLSAVLYPTSNRLAQSSWPLTQAAEAKASGGTMITGDLDALVCIEAAKDPALDPRPARSQPEDPEEIVLLVDQAMRHLNEYDWLGESPLVARLGIAGGTHIACGKALRDRLESAIEGLRPAGPAPKQPWPRNWQAHAVLRLAYLEEVPNREIMARLYLAESTFARLRRKAVRAVARSLVERAGAAAQPGGAWQPDLSL